MSPIKYITSRWHKYNFLFVELVKRDFKKKYKRTVLGIVWSLLAPLAQLLFMTLIFGQFFGAAIPHFVIFVFSGLLVYQFYVSATTGGMNSIVANGDIITKTNAPKYIFLLSSNVSALINFGMTLVIYFLLAAIDGVPINLRLLLLLYPITCLLILNIGVGLIISTLYVFFRDLQYLYGIFTMLLLWVSAVIHPVHVFPVTIQRLFILNPIFTYIQYFRLVVLYGAVPSLNMHLIAGFYALFAFTVGCFIYWRYNHKFVYYF